MDSTTPNPTSPGTASPHPARTVAPAAAAPPRVRGGLSISSVVTGAVVAGAAVVLFTLLGRAIATYLGYRPYLLPIGGTRRPGLLAAILSGAGLFVAFAWGGYAGARMARGRGWVHGLLVAITALVLTAVGLGVLAFVRPGPGFNVSVRLPSGYPHLAFLLPRWLVRLSAMAIALAGAVLGGLLGGGFHGRLERQAQVREQETLAARESFRDLREALASPDPAGPATPAGSNPPPPGSSTGPLPASLEGGITA